MDNELSKEIWNHNYKYGDEANVHQMWRRMAHACSQVEKEENKEVMEHEFYNILLDWKFVPGGRIMANLGTNRKNTTLLNCFVHNPGDLRYHDPDSIDGIYDMLKAQANTLKSEGGYGMNFSWIRPKGTYIHGIDSRTPGVVKFMELWDKSSEIITMGSDIIVGEIKKSEKKKIRKGAMMGILSCLAGNTPIDTISGKVPIKDLVGTKPYIYCTNLKGDVLVRQANKVWSVGTRKTIKVHLDNHDYIECTPDHKFLLSNNTWREAKDLKLGDSLAALNRVLYSKKYIYVGVAGTRKKIAEHHAVYEMKYGSYPTCGGKNRKPWQTIAHHMDENKLNNHPDNIERMTLRKHGQHHSVLLEEHRQRIAIERKGLTWEEYYGEDKANEIREKYTAKRKGQPAWNKGVSGENYKDHYENGFSNQFSENENHKVIFISESVEQEVFDISVPEFHNFSARGIFVHNCWHPEIMNFIKAKQTPNRLTKFNMSVGIFDDFMTRVKNDYKWDLKFPDTEHPAYKTEWDGNIYAWEAKNYPIIIYDTIDARELWDSLMTSTYTRNEPGIIFFDIANEMSPMAEKEFNQTANPCGEIIMPLDACLLGSINLTQFINNYGHFDLDEFEWTVKLAIRFLDNINDITNLPLPEYKAAKKQNRRIGLGTMGLGSLHFMLGIRYGSEESLQLIKQIYKRKTESELIASAELGQEKGSFPGFDPNHYFNTKWWKTLPIATITKQIIEGMGYMRNSHRSMNAPTGNTSTLANQVSGGIEPVFLKTYLRWMIVPEHDRIQLKAAGLKFPEALNGEWFETKHLKFSKRGDEQILKGTFENIDYEVDKNRGLIKSVLVKDYGWEFAATKMRDTFFKKCEINQVFATTEELTVGEHLKVLAVIAKYVDQNSSKTVNLPNDYSYKNFKTLYFQAWLWGIKGLTTYRAGTMTAVLEKKKENVRYQNELDELFAKVGDDVIKDINIRLPNQYYSKGYIRRDRNKKKWYIHIAFADSSCLKPFALFVSTNSKETTEVADVLIETIEILCQSKGIAQKLVEALKVRCAGQSNTVKIARAIGLALRHNINIKDIVETLEKFDEEFSSFVYHLTKLLSQFIKDGTKAINETCPECEQDTIIYYEGCKQCKQCNWSRC